MTLIDRIKISEDAGFKTKGYPYRDHLGYKTIGYGTRLPLSEEECTLLLKHRLDLIIVELRSHKPIIDIIGEVRYEVLVEMAYQLGVPKLLRFKRMWAAISAGDFERASLEMLDSRWAKQTPQRAIKLAKIMKTNKVT